MRQSLFVLSALPAAFALQWLGPRATPDPSLPDGHGVSPKPTDGPQYNVVANKNLELKLFRRQSRSKYANTCGYVNGNGEYSITCSGAYACAYDTQNYAFGCKYLGLKSYLATCSGRWKAEFKSRNIF